MIPGGADGQLGVEVATTLEAGERLRDEWATLHATSATANPFTHPAWMLTWARHFSGDQRVVIVVVRRHGRLIGVAPFARIGPRRGVRALHPMGNNRSVSFTEMPSALARREDARVVLRAVVEHLQADGPGWDWVKFALDHEQGWFEAQWIEKGSMTSPPFVLPHRARAFVMLDLPATWEEFLAARKRNVRESIRRSFNRLRASSGTWSVDLAAGSALPAAVDRVIQLHGDRSTLPGKPSHPTQFGSAASAAFYRDAVVALAAEGLAEVSLLRVDGQVVAGLVALRAGDTVFTSASGADPRAWDLGPGTVLLAELARREIDRRTRVVNLSAGPNQSKLRWSERLEYGHDFVMVGAGRKARARFTAYSQLRLLADIAQARNWDLRRPGG